MPTRLPLTDKRARDAAKPEKGRILIYDEECPGLALAITHRDSRTWYAVKRGQYTGSDGNSHYNMIWSRLGRLAELSVKEARKRAQYDVGLIARGENPNETKEKERQAAQERARGGKVPLVGKDSAVTWHLSELKSRGCSKQHMEEVERVANDAAGAKVTDLADPKISEKADTWLKSLDVSDLTRHRYRAHLVAIGKTAHDRKADDGLAREPFRKLPGKVARLPDPAVFMPWECAQLVSDKALKRDGGPLWAFLVLSGCRWKEAAWARWDCIDLGRATLQIIPPDAVERAAGKAVKRDKPRVVSLQPELVTLLRQRQGAGYVFDDKWRNQWHVRNTMAFRAHLEALSIPLAGRKIHSLRHAHCCLAIACGQDPMILRLSMGHAGEEMQAHYASRAMRWRGSLIHWAGVFRLREPAEVAKLKAWADNTPGPTDK